MYMEIIQYQSKLQINIVLSSDSITVSWHCLFSKVTKGSFFFFLDQSFTKYIIYLFIDNISMQIFYDKYYKVVETVFVNNY